MLRHGSKEIVTPVYSLPPEGLLKFSWILPQRLAVGPAPRNYRALKKLGFSAALNLQEDSEPGPAGAEVPEGFTVARVPIRDGIIGGIPTVEQIAEAVETLEDLVRQGAVYVHCFAGVGRSPMVCMAYLAGAEGKDLEEAREFVASRHIPAAPSESQLETVERYLGLRSY